MTVPSLLSSTGTVNSTIRIRTSGGSCPSLTGSKGKEGRSAWLAEHPSDCLVVGGLWPSESGALGVVVDDWESVIDSASGRAVGEDMIEVRRMTILRYH